MTSSTRLYFLFFLLSNPVLKPIRIASKCGSGQQGAIAANFDLVWVVKKKKKKRKKREKERKKKEKRKKKEDFPYVFGDHINAFFSVI